MKKINFYYFIFLYIGFSLNVNSQTTLISQGSSWKYLDNGTNQGSSWKEITFNDIAWLQGNSELGYGDGDEATVVGYGPNASNKYITTYFRKTFSITNISQFTSYTLKVKRDDGVAIFVNGNEVYRNNLVANASSTSLATSAADDGTIFLTVSLPSGTFISGNNTIAAEIHQSDGGSSDICFDLELLGNDGSQLKHIRWGTTKNPLEGLTITWRDTGTSDLIKWGYTISYEQGTFPGISRTGYTDTFFNYTFPTVNPNSTIYYQLFDSQNNTWTVQKTFQTSPPINTDAFSFVAFGDSRGGIDVWQTISNLTNSKLPDFTVFNGDIVSDANITSQWDDWFDYGKTFLEKNLVLHALGNHDALSVPNYLNNFELPKSTPVTGTELYYAVPYGEAVFISLDSEIPNDVAQYNWLVSTLQANASKKWKIVFFHKPFYTIGPHIGEMDSYFNTWWKAFDDYGVDLILNGHDHMYERSKPINRNISLTSPVASYGSQPYEGRCEIVCGGAGAGLTDPSTAWFIESFKKSHNLCNFDVTPTSLCGTIYDNNNIIIDAFCISKPLLSTNDQKQVFYPIKIMPNPVANFFRIYYTSPNIGDVKISMFDLNGKIIESKTSNKLYSEFTFEYDATNLASGVYSVEIEMDNQKDHSLLIKK